MSKPKNYVYKQSLPDIEHVETLRVHDNLVIKQQVP